MKRFLLSSLCFMLVGFGANFQSYAKDYLTIGTSVQGASYYVLGAAYATYVNNQYPELDLSVEVGGGPYNNVSLISSDEIQIGFATTWATGDMFAGKYKDNVEHSDIRAFLPLYPSYLQIYALADNPVKTLSQMNGKILSSGPAGASGRNATLAILEALNIEPDRLNAVPSSAQVNNMKDAMIDVGFTVASVPAPFMMELEATNKVHMIGFTEEEGKLIIEKQPTWALETLPMGAYNCIDREIKAVTFWNIAIVNKNLPEDIVYKLTKAGFEGKPELESAVRDMTNMKPEDILKANIPLHKGAIRYFEEIGIKIPDALIPPEAK